MRLSFIAIVFEVKMNVKDTINKDNKNYALILATLDKQTQQQGRQKMPIFDCHRLA